MRTGVRKDTVREACRKGRSLDGADAKALEHALTITERERDAARQLHSETLDALVRVEREEVAALKRGVEIPDACRPHVEASEEYLALDTRRINDLSTEGYRAWKAWRDSLVAALKVVLPGPSRAVADLTTGDETQCPPDAGMNPMAR